MIERAASRWEKETARSSRAHALLPTTMSLEALEPRQLMTAAGLTIDSSMLARYGITSTASNSVIHAPLAIRSFSSGISLFDSFSSTAPDAARYRSQIRLDQFTSDTRFRNFDGRGFSTVILDTGIDLNSTAFGPDVDNNGISDRIVYQYDFADNDTNAGDRNGHGSNVSSIAASSDGSYPGVASGSNIIMLKVFSDSGAGSFGTIERALQWVVGHAQQYNIASVNMSLGDSGNNQVSAPQYGIGDELAALASQNIIVVAAAGNSYYDLGSVPGISYPASDPSVLAVGAVYSGSVGGYTYGGGAQAFTTSVDQLTPFSQRSSAIQTIFAPGAPMTGSGIDGSPITMHGTSQASPVIAGVATLAQQLAMSALGRRLSPAEFRALISSSGVSITDTANGQDNVQHTNATYKRVDVEAMGEAILAMAAPVVPPPPPPPAHVNRAPTLTAIRTFTGGWSGRTSELTYEALSRASNARDADADPIRFVIRGVDTGRCRVTKNGVAVTNGVTLGPGESLLITPNASFRGVLRALTVVASDGALFSRSAASVNIVVNRAAVQFLNLSVRSQSQGLVATRVAATQDVARASAQFGLPPLVVGGSPSQNPAFDALSQQPGVLLRGVQLGEVYFRAA